MKENHIYKISYLPEFRKGPFDLCHCFEGLAMAKKGSDDKIRLYDTYWGIGYTTGKSFSREDVGVKIEIKHYCDFKKITSIAKDETKYYNDRDIIRLTRQHACVSSCIAYYIKKGARKSKSKILSSLRKIILDAECEIGYKTREIKKAKENIDRVMKGDLDIFI